MISDEDIRRVREATDLVDLVSETVVLQRRAREFWGRCPFHEEKTASFKVDPRSQLYHCFGCHAGGDAYGFVMRTQDMPFVDAVRYLADRANITLTETQGTKSQGKRARLLELMAASAHYYALQLQRAPTPGAEAARSYLSGRAMGTKIAKQWQLGYAPGGTQLLDHLRSKGYTIEECLDANVAVKSPNARARDRFYGRVMFPVADLLGHVIAFGGRIIDEGEPKYLNSSETLLFHKRETLYALDKAKATITSRGMAIVVEGYTDTIAMHEAGFTNTVATLGTALTVQHLKLLNRFAKKAIYLFDGDEAGKRAAARAAELITQDITPEAGRFRVLLEVAELPPGTDPADLLAQNGTAALQEILKKSLPLLKYALQQSLRNADLSSPEGRSAALRSALTVLLPIRGSILATEYIADELVAQLGVDYSAAIALFNSMQAPRAPETDRERDSSDSRRGQGGGSSRNFDTADPSADLSRSQSASPVSANGQLTSAGIQNELILLFIEHAEVRDLLARAFERIAWSSPELTELARGLAAAERDLPSNELYALALQLAPSYASLLSAGPEQEFSGEIGDYARLLMYMLREIQLQEEITLAKIAYSKLAASAEGEATFKEIADKQLELATIRERLAEIPKMTF
ncbi:MAG: DNA primase [Coriobacteriales bacterium]|nr:DNA primase [Coriobacteriales bacterium]